MLKEIPEQMEVGPSFIKDLDTAAILNKSILTDISKEDLLSAADEIDINEDLLKLRLLEENKKTSKILLIGAGGIGCEVLKNLVMENFPYIEIIDLDTIDVSNLNRQFLFNRKHVSQAKAIVARETALKFNPNVEIKAHHDTIFNPDFGVGYFKEFTLVVNALDNRAARNHVNRMCLAADVPLIETGTAGYVGQVEMISKGKTQCYECDPKPAAKSFPGCTIRNTPSEPIHCIVWAKHLFNQLFGEEDADNDVSPDYDDPELRESGENVLEPVPSTSSSSDGPKAKRIKLSEDAKPLVEAAKSTRDWARSVNYSHENLFKKIFIEDINYLLRMESLWKKRRAPAPLEFELVSLADKQHEEAKYPGLERKMKVWTQKMCVKVFIKSLQVLAKRAANLPSGDFLTWDKDDDIALDFVTACAALRSYNYSIPIQSQFNVKAMAGNIIPAIATANAIIAGLAVAWAENILKGTPESNTTIYLRKHPNDFNILFRPERKLVPPKANCYVCSKRQIDVELDINRTTVKAFEEGFLKHMLNFIAPDATITATSTILISSEEETINSQNSLAELGVHNGTILTIDDYQQEYQLDIVVHHKEREKDEEPFKIIRS